MDHVLSIELPSYFSDQYAHAGEGSDVVNTHPNFNVSLSTNDPPGSSGNSNSGNDSPGSSGNYDSGSTDGHHDHDNCSYSHENTVDMTASANQNNPCCLC